MEISGYLIETKIAEGGMATIYLALQESLERPVALKILKHTDNPSFSQRFLEEGRTIAALNHPNIITIYDIGIADGKHFISMEYVEGGDLARRIKSGLSTREALSITRRPCLQFLHDNGVVHRDIKPGNILFRPDGTPLLTDFGIAKQLRIDSELTQDGTTLGSPYYLSPEQAEGGEVDGRADIYSLGIMLYEMLSGSRPFVGKTTIDTILLQISEPLPRLAEPHGHLQDLLDRMTAKKPEERFPDAKALVEAIDELAKQRRSAKRVKKKRGSPSATAEEPRPTMGRFRKPALLGAAVTLLLLGTTAALLSLRGGDPDLEEKPVIGEQAPPPQQPAEKAPSPTTATPQQATAATEPRVREEKSTSEKREARIDRVKLELYLRLGNKRFNQDKLTTPETDCALHYYRKALALDPDNKRAKTGIASVADRYATLTAAAIQKYDYETAKTMLQRGMAIDPNHAELKRLEPRVWEISTPSRRIVRGAEEEPRRLWRRIKKLWE
jgi:serine/threonine protein kinase